MLKKRIITAVFLLAVFFLCLLLLSTIWFAIVISLLLLMAAWEWANLCDLPYRAQRFCYCLLLALLFIALGFYLAVPTTLVFDTSKVLMLLLIAAAWWAVALLWLQGYPASTVLWGSRWARALMGCFVLLPTAVAFVFLHGQPQGSGLILLLVAIVAVADIGAYFAGRAFGRRKLAKLISPGKSWEGFCGGLLSCVLLALMIAAVTHVSPWLMVLAIILPTALASVLGDLLESMVKRHRGIKHSGTVLPGHGGLLDRFDGFTAAAPIFALAVMLSEWQLA